MPDTATKEKIEDDEMMEDEKSEESAKSKKSGGMMQTAIIIALFQVVIAVGAYFFIKMAIAPHMKNVPASSGQSQAEKSNAESQGAREVKLIENIVVNPAGTNGTRYLSTSIGLELDKTPEGEKLMEEKTPVIRDIIIAVLTSKTLEELSSAEGKDNIRTEIQSKLSEAIAPVKVHRIYFVDYVLQ